MAVFPTPESPTKMGLFSTPAEDLKRPLQLALTADERVNAAFSGLHHEVDGEGLERVADRRPLLLRTAGLSVGVLLGLSPFGDAVGEEIEEVQPGDAFLLEKMQGVALVLAEHRHQDVAALDDFLVCAERVDGRPLQHPLDADGLLGLSAHPHWQLLHRLFEEGLQALFEPLHVGAAGGEDFLRLGLFAQRQQQVLEG